ncbi:MAG: 50S ribosomal protein L29 [Chloroflexi bacterium]|nr:50S ribosomal protein L29 [Chloroflexota bacterium]
MAEKQKIADLRALSSAELDKQLEESRQALFNLRFRLATKQLVNNRELPKTRKKVARILTLLRERELGLKAE